MPDLDVLKAGLGDSEERSPTRAAPCTAVTPRAGGWLAAAGAFVFPLTVVITLFYAHGLWSYGRRGHAAAMALAGVATTAASLALRLG